MYKVCCDYVKPKYNKPKLCCMDTDSSTVHVKTTDIYEKIV